MNSKNFFGPNCMNFIHYVHFVPFCPCCLRKSSKRRIDPWLSWIEANRKRALLKARPYVITQGTDIFFLFFCFLFFFCWSDKAVSFYGMHIVHIAENPFWLNNNLKNREGKTFNLAKLSMIEFEKINMLCLWFYL